MENKVYNTNQFERGDIMAYFLTIKEGNNYRKLDISDMVKFERLSSFKGSTCSLEEIDKFTSKFANEQDLKLALYNYNLITIDEFLKDISIRRTNKKENSGLEKVMYDPVYERSYKYLDIEYLRSILLEKQKDYNFLGKLVIRYRNSHVNGITINGIRNYLFSIPGRNIYDLLNEFYVNEIISVNEKGEANIKYKSLHDLAMFIFNYDEKVRLAKEGITEDERKRKLKEDLMLMRDVIIEENQKDEYDDVRSEYEKAKKRIKIKKENKEENKEKKEEGQISLFD